jgi:hypothetical protein
MRVRALAITAVVLTTLTGCIQLPAEVAAVVRESDPPALNNFLPETPPARAATNVQSPPP